jgi:hypothetical protein
MRLARLALGSSASLLGTIGRLLCKTCTGGVRVIVLQS